MSQQQPVIQDLLQQALREHQAGRLEVAKSIYKQVLGLSPSHPDALHLLGVATLQQGDAETAMTYIRRAIDAWPGNPAFHGNLAQACLTSGRPDDAHAAFQRALALDPRNPQFAVGQANCLATQGHLSDAEQQLRRVVQSHPTYALAWLNLGNAVRDQHRAEESATLYRHATQLDPALADAWNNLGAVLHGLERFEEAEQAHRRHLELEPRSIMGHCNLVAVLMDRGRFDEAVDLSQRGLRLEPGAVELQLMAGAALMHLGKPATALAVFRTTAGNAPDNARACLGYGLTSYEVGDTITGRRWLEQALALQPDAAEFQNAAATAHLALGEFQDGWQRYEGRPSRQQHTAEHPDAPLALELPADLRGRTICLLGEQGLGDQLFSLRFIENLARLGANPICRMHPKLVPLLARDPSLGRFIATEDRVPQDTITMLLGDLPRALGQCPASPWPRSDRGGSDAMALNLSGSRRWLRVFHPELPRSIALAPLVSRLDALKQELARIGPPPYVGITWRAGTTPEQQRGKNWALHKAAPLENLGDALRPVRCTLLALQRHPETGEIAELSRRVGRPLNDFTDLNEDLESMLALLALLDDYVTVSNTNVHLRAAAGRSARVLMPRPTEWRWMYAGSESPWFPGFAVYRQGIDGDWNGTLAQLTRDLQALAR